MKRKALILPIVIAVFIIWIFFSFLHGFGPEYSSEEIKQNIGGVLICKSVYNADHHSWLYDVNYSYKDKSGKTFEIGNGTYDGREWKKDEQLVPFKNWFILKTGAWGDADKVIIGDSQFRRFNQYEFTPDNIVKDSIWINEGIHPLLNWLPCESIITRIDGGVIEVTYKFRVDETNADKFGVRKVVYKVEPKTGEPIMTAVLKIE